MWHFIECAVMEKCILVGSCVKVKVKVKVKFTLEQTTKALRGVEAKLVALLFL